VYFAIDLLNAFYHQNMLLFDYKFHNLIAVKDFELSSKTDPADHRLKNHVLLHRD